MSSNSNTNFYTYDFIDTSFNLNELSLKDSSNNNINANDIDYSNNFIIINNIYYSNFSYKIITYEDILELIKYFYYNFPYHNLFEIYLTGGKISSNVNYTKNINLCITYKDNNNKDYNIIYECLNFLITNGVKYFNVLVDVYYYDNLDYLNNYYEKYNIRTDLCYNNIYDFFDGSNNDIIIDISNLIFFNKDISKCINDKLKNNDFRNSIINYNISCGEILNVINYYYLYNIDLSINYVKRNNLNYQNIINISNNDLYSFDINKVTNYDDYFSNTSMHGKFLWVYANNMNYNNPIKIYDCGVFNSKYVKLDSSNNYVINYISLKNTDISNIDTTLLYI